MAAQMREPEDHGFVPLKRRFFNHPFWKEKRVFSKAEAWLDMIQTARFEESETYSIAGNRKVSWKRGQFPASFRFLATRWQWGKHKVELFIKFLHDEEMISSHLEDGQTIITLLKYDEHNKTSEKTGHKRSQQKGQQNAPPESVSPAGGDSKGDESGEIEGTRRGHGGDKTNKVNKENKEKEEITGAGAPAQSADEIKFKQFQEWILKWAPRVAKMEKPFTIQEWSTIRKDIDKETLSKLLRTMHNWKPLLKKNVSSYLTALNWSTLDHNKNQTNGQNHGTATQQGHKIAAAIEQIESQRSAQQ